MANDKDNYKEGVDYELVLMKNQPKGGTNKTRRFFTKAEKAAKSAPKAAPAKAKPSTPTKAAKASVAPTQDAMKGYRKGDVVTSPLPQDIAAATRKAIAIPAPNKAAKTGTTKPMPQRPISPTRSPTATGRFSEYETARLGNVTKAQYDAMSATQREAKGLPVSWVEYLRAGGKGATKPTGVRNLRGGGAYAKGGMAKKGKC